MSDKPLKQSVIYIPTGKLRQERDIYRVFAYSGLKIVFIVRAIHDVLCFNYLFPCLNLDIMNVVTTI